MGLRGYKVQGDRSVISDYYGTHDATNELRTPCNPVIYRPS
jgi:hypothetical protein